MQGLEVSGAVRLIYGSLGVKRLSLGNSVLMVKMSLNIKLGCRRYI